MVGVACDGGGRVWRWVSHVMVGSRVMVGVDNSNVRVTGSRVKLCNLELGVNLVGVLAGEQGFHESSEHKVCLHGANDLAE